MSVGEAVPAAAPAVGGRRLVGAWLVVALIACSLANGFLPGVPAWPAGLCACAAAVILFTDLRRHLKLQALALGVLGAVAMLFAGLHGAEVPLARAISINQAILAMLAAVGFIRIIGETQVRTDEALPGGRSAVARTLVGTALIGAAINVSAIVIVGDRIARAGQLSRLQGIVLSRAFASTALWSPFFASMATAMIYAPGASLPLLVGLGLPVGLASLGYSLRELLADPESNDFRGYPTHRSALLLPTLLAGSVLLGHQLAPTLPILTLISALALVLTVGLGARALGRGMGPRLRRFVHEDLAGMSSELVLFIAAGIFAVGTLALARALAFELPFEGFGAAEAAIVVLSTTALGAIGLHPIIAVSTWSGLLLPLSPAPDLLGLTFLMAWSGGVAISPMSGLHLFIQGRFGVPAHSYLRWNARFTAAMLFIDVTALFTYEHMLA